MRHQLPQANGEALQLDVIEMVLPRSCHANHKCDRSSVNETKSALFAETSNDRVADDAHAGRFAAISTFRRAGHDAATARRPGTPTRSPN
jgi:hypothetical protein